MSIHVLGTRPLYARDTLFRLDVRTTIVPAGKPAVMGIKWTIATQINALVAARARTFPVIHAKIAPFACLK